MRPITYFGLLGASMLLCMGCGKDAKPTGDTTQAPPVQPPGPGPKQTDPPKSKGLGEAKYRVAVKDFLSEYRKDSKAAQAKYLDTIIEVSGVTTHHPQLGKTGWLPPSSPEFGYIWDLPFMDMSEGKLVALGTWGRDLSVIGRVFIGQQIKLKGRVKGAFPGGPFQLQECEIVELGSDPSVRITAEQLASSSKDRENLNSKCKGKSVVVSGTVLAMVREDIAEFTELKGDGGTRVLCALGLSWQYFEKGFPPGEKIEFVGTLSTSERPGIVMVTDCVPVNRLSK